MSSLAFGAIDDDNRCLTKISNNYLGALVQGCREEGGYRGDFRQTFVRLLTLVEKREAAFYRQLLTKVSLILKLPPASLHAAAPASANAEAEVSIR